MCITSSLIAAKLYWFWKGPLIQHYFDKLRDGDILIFSDSEDVMDGWGWTHKLLKTMLSKNNTFALYETDFLEHSWTKKDIEAAGMCRFRHCWKPADAWQLSSGRLGAARCGAVWRGAVRFCAVLCGSVRCSRVKAFLAVWKRLY
jgi:hypothetical protein